MNTETQVQIIDPKEFGIEEVKATTIEQSFLPKKIETDGYSEVYKNILSMDIEDVKTAMMARELRLKLVKVRTGIAEIHKAEKAFYLASGKYCDALKNKLTLPVVQMEEKLMEIEKYRENLEKQRVEELREKRLSELEIYSEFVPFGIELGKLSEDEYLKVLNGAKLQYEAKLEAERKAEEERKRLEEIQKLHNERKDKLLDVWQFIENKNQNFGELSASEFSQLLDFAKKDKLNYEKEQERIRIENERLAKEKAEAEEKARKEREEAERKLAEERAKQEEALRIEREKQAKLEAELRAKQEAEEKAEKERLAEQERQRKEAEKLAKAPIKKQMLAWIDLFLAPEKTVQNELSDEILLKFESFKKWAKSEIEKL